MRLLVIKQRKVMFTVIALIIVINTLLVFHFGQNKFSLSESINLFIKQFDNLSNIGLDINTTSNNENILHLPQDDVNQQPDLIEKSKLHKETYYFENDSLHGELPQVDNICSKLIHNPQQKNIYKWLDDNSIIHISDKPRKIHSDSPVTIVGSIKPEMVSINYIDVPNTYNLQNKINARVMKAKEMFELVVSKSLVTPVSINFRLFDNQTLYKSYQKLVAPSLSANLGFYMGNTNESVVMMTSETQGTNTAVHEAMHAINRHWFGNMSKWLNEGMAEYAETDHSLPIQNNHWYSSIRQKRLIPLHQLFQVNKDEWRAQESRMYGTSWAFVAYLMQQQPPLLSRLLMEESYNGCSKLNVQDIERVSGKSISALQREFNRWLRSLTT